ncbi:pantothenate kinase [Salmonella enterica subsp. arizonae]|uniref:Pantothenate kinase n=1 Tax=Salmonella enterica subsp. arizonae TaxID=59203 RepID=A0A379TI29_SALER|nr:pantothenate kinase [Salmonella enterica subsp. arizonae]
MFYKAAWIILTIRTMYLSLISLISLFTLMRQKNFFRHGISNRFLKFRDGAFTDPDSYFHNYAKIV